MNYHFIFTYVPFAFALVAWGLYVRAARYRVRGQALALIAVLLAAAKFLAFAAFGGDAFKPHLPAAVIWGWNWIYSSVFVLLALSFVGLVARRICCRRGDGRLARLVLPLGALALAGWGCLNGLIAPRVRTLELVYDDLPPALDGYRIVQLSDLHVSSAAGEWRTREVVALANALEPDCICVTGDIVDGGVGELAHAVRPLAGLKAADGVWAVTGNHEYYNPWPQWRALLEQGGMRFLENRSVRLRDALVLGGANERFPDPARAFAASGREAFRVLMQHRPSRARANAAAHGVRLQLSGHTHGGIMPLADRLIARFNGGFVHGLYPLAAAARSYLVVSRGTGQWAGFPVRFFNPSEINLIILRRP